MTATFFPMRDSHMRPAFWGVERDLKEVLDSIDSVWNGVSETVSSEFKETDQAYFLSLDLPGVNKANLDLQIEGERLIVNGTRKRVMPEGEDKEQKITRNFLLPKHIDTEKIQAHCEDGVLYIALPKLEKVKPKKIEITQGTTKSGWSLFKKKESAPQLVE